VQSGQPIAISRTAVNNGQSAKLANPTIAEWFNTAVFTTAAAYTYGNVGPYLPNVRGDFQRNLDAVLVRNFSSRVLDRPITSQFRFEVFNITSRIPYSLRPLTEHSTRKALESCRHRPTIRANCSSG
jgi:hypothetical protein